MVLRDIVPQREEYKRESLRPKEDYINQCASLVIMKHDIPMDEARSLVKAYLSSNDENIGVAKPKVKCYVRDDTGDKRVCNVPLDVYHNVVLESGDIIAPSYTCYLSPDVKKSLLSKYMERNVALRNKYKQIMFLAYAENRIEDGDENNEKQTKAKLSNNIVSGEFGVCGSILFNKSSHSTATSTTRLITSTANSGTERLLAANRHYHEPLIVEGNILSIINYFHVNDLEDKWDEVITRYNLHLPSVDDVMAMVIRCSIDYWDNKSSYTHIREMLRLLKPNELAYFLYTGDLYSLRKHNDSLLRNLIADATHKTVGGELVEDHLKEIKEVPHDVLNYLHHLFSEELKGKGTDYSKISHQIVSDMIHTANTVDQMLNHKYYDLLNTLLMTTNLAPCVAEIRHMVRDAIVASDTDSKIDTMQEWVEWMVGDTLINEETFGAASLLALIDAKVLDHNLRVISINMGIKGKALDGLRMKSEFTWKVFINLAQSKHYYAGSSIIETNVLAKNELVRKGNALQSSAIPKDILDFAKTMMVEIIDTIEENKKIDLQDVIKRIIEMEGKVMRSVNRKEYRYLRGVTIKGADSYKNKVEEENPFQWVNFWNETFHREGFEATSAGFRFVKIPSLVYTRAKVSDWVVGIDNVGLSNNIKKWVERHAKKGIPTMYMPAIVAKSKGIPDELHRVLDRRRVVMDVCNILYIVIEGLGYYKSGDITLCEATTGKVKSLNEV